MSEDLTQFSIKLAEKIYKHFDVLSDIILKEDAELFRRLGER